MRVQLRRYREMVLASCVGDDERLMMGGGWKWCCGTSLFAGPRGLDGVALHYGRRIAGRAFVVSVSVLLLRIPTLLNCE